ncbi:MAG: hypothetical protein V1645_04915 [archaeon]
MSLEAKLADKDTPRVKDRIIEKLASRNYKSAASRDNPYFKYELLPSIVSRINEYAPTDPNFASALNHINKAEAKKIYYGLVCLGQPIEELKLVLRELTDWEKAAFFAGVWNPDNRQMTGIRSKSVPQIVQEHIKAGYDLIHEKHMIKYAKGEYKRPIKMPESQKHRKSTIQKERSALESLASNFQVLLGANDTSYESEERIGMFLDGCSEDQLRYLTKKFGAEALSGYAVR